MEHAAHFADVVGIGRWWSGESLRGASCHCIVARCHRMPSPFAGIIAAMNSNAPSLIGSARLLDSGQTNRSSWRWLTAAVLVHLVVSIVHGTVHSRAQVPLSHAASLFVFGV